MWFWFRRGPQTFIQCFQERIQQSSLRSTKENAYHSSLAGDPAGIVLASVAQRLDSAIRRINVYPLDSTMIFPNTNPLNSDLSGG